MKASVFAIAAAATLVSAQNFGSEPACAIPCLTSAISQAGCAETDEGCQCGTGMAAIQSAVAPCLLSACNQSDLALAASVGFALCSVYSASLASASAVTTTSVTSTSTGVSTTPSSTSTVTATSTSLSSPTTTSSSVSSKATTSKATSSTGSATAASSTSSPSQVSTAGAPVVVAGMGGLVGVIAAVAAAL